MIPIMECKLTIFSEDDTRQSSVKTQHNVGVGWQTYLPSRRDVIVATVQSSQNSASLDSLYHTLRSDNISPKIIILSLNCNAITS